MKSIRTGSRQYGALPIRMTDEGTLQVLLITSRETRRWLVPKGWPMKGRSNAAAAAIEATEEAGVTGRIVGKRIGRYHYDKVGRSGLKRRLEVRLFLLVVQQELDDWPEAGERTRCWMEPGEAAAVVEEPSLAWLLRRLPSAIRAAGVEFTDGDAPGVQLLTALHPN